MLPKVRTETVPPIRDGGRAKFWPPAERRFLEAGALWVYPSFRPVGVNPWGIAMLLL